MASNTYLGNPKLKNVGVKIDFTFEQAREIARCKRDPIYFIKNYVKINNVDHGIVSFILWPFQERMIKTFNSNRFSICKIGRQSGKSTVVIAYLLWCVLFTDPDKPYRIALLAHKEKQSRELLSRLQMAYENLPFWMQQGVEIWNKSDIKLENQSIVMAAATSSASIRGNTFNLVYLDEYAHVPFNLQEDFYSSTFPAITSGQTTKVIITSTPKGYNHFHKLWIDARNGKNGYQPLEVHWSEIPGRDEEWRDTTIKLMGSETQFEQEYGCAFLGSSDTLISSAKLANITFDAPIHEVGFLRYFEQVKENHAYIICVDVAEGVGLDFSAFVVIDITSIPYKVVCTYKSNDIHPMIFPKYILDVGRYYNNAQVLVETNGLGTQVIDIMFNDYEYENMISTAATSNRLVATFGFGRKSTMGVKTTKSVKRLGCATLKTLIENDKLFITDHSILHELERFVFNGSSYEAEEGDHDDLVMCCVIFAWLTTQTFFKDLTDNDTVKHIFEESTRLMEDELVPPGFYHTGTENERDYLSTSEFNDWAQK